MRLSNGQQIQHDIPKARGRKLWRCTYAYRLYAQHLPSGMRYSWLPRTKIQRPPEDREIRLCGPRGQSKSQPLPPHMQSINSQITTVHSQLTACTLHEYCTYRLLQLFAKR